MIISEIPRFRELEAPNDNMSMSFFQMQFSVQSKHWKIFTPSKQNAWSTHNYRTSPGLMVPLKWNKSEEFFQMIIIQIYTTMTIETIKLQINVYLGFLH